MDQTTKPSFSSRSNAKRAAEKAIADGTAPSVDYSIKPTDEGRFEIVWKSASGTSAASTTEQVEAELAEAATEPERAAAEQGDGAGRGRGARRHADQAGRDPKREQPYQKRFDKLTELAAAGDWDGVADYQCNGVNSCAKMVRSGAVSAATEQSQSPDPRDPRPNSEMFPVASPMPGTAVAHDIKARLMLRARSTTKVSSH